MSDNDVNKIQQNVKELQDQNAIDFQQWKKLSKDIEKLSEKIKISDTNLVTLMKKIKSDYKSLKKIIVDENIQVQLNNKIEINKNEIVDSKNKIEFNKNEILDTKNKIDEINSQIIKKVDYFETVSSMKTSNKIKKDSLCITLGYYKSEDGGGAIYRITDNPPLENGFSFSVSKGLTAELLYNDEISIKQIGARDYDDKGNKVDIKPFIELYISKTNPINNVSNKKTVKLFIPAGRWFSSPLKIKSSSIYIYGVNIYSYPYATGTLIMPLQNNQEYLWIIGDNTTDNKGVEYGNNTLKSIMFSTHNPSQNDTIYVGGLTADKCFTCQKLLHISRVYGGVFENIHFTNYIGTPLTINSSNESIFNDFSFRNGDAFETGNVVFDRDITGNKNISACFFDKFSFEGIKGDLITFNEDCKFINNHFGTIMFEDRQVKISNNGVFKNYTISTDENKSFTSKAVINIKGQDYCEVIIDNILLNNFGRTIFIFGTDEYLFDTIVKKNGKVSKGQVNIKVISNVGARRDTLLLNESDYEGLGSYNFNFTCENARHVDSDNFKFMVKTTGIMKPNIHYKEIGYNRCIDYVNSPNAVLTKNSKTGYYMPVITDNESLNNEKLVIDNFQYKKYVPTFTAESSCFIVPVLGNKLHIRLKTKAGFLAQCFLVETPTQYENHTVKDVEEKYKWYTIDLTSYRETNVEKELKIAIRTLTEDETNYVRLDVFYWE